MNRNHQKTNQIHSDHEKQLIEHKETCLTTADMSDEELEHVCKDCTKRCLKHERAESALDEVLGRIDVQNIELGQTIQQNIDTIVMPLVGEIEQSMPTSRRALVEQLRKQLEAVTDPFLDRISSAFENLSPSELKVCTLIKNDMSTKEIAGLLHLSPSTINRHREHVRKKLGIVNNRTNLKRYLQTHFEH